MIAFRRTDFKGYFAPPAAAAGLRGPRSLREQVPLLEALVPEEGLEERLPELRDELEEGVGNGDVLDEEGRLLGELLREDDFPRARADEGDADRQDEDPSQGELRSLLPERDVDHLRVRLEERLPPLFAGADGAGQEKAGPGAR